MKNKSIQRRALTLSAYKYTIRYRTGSKIGNADGLSRLPLPLTSAVVVPLPGELTNLLNHLCISRVDARQMKQKTDEDVTLSRVRRCILSGSPLPDAADFKPFQNRYSELSVLFRCLLLGSRGQE